MRLLRSIFVPVVLLCAAVFSQAQKAPTTPTPAILPQSFAGWQLKGKLQISADANLADPVNAGILKEYGFTDVAIGNYARDDGRSLTLRAARFTDATGAFGAYTFYLQPDMTREEIGDQGASLGRRVLFYRGQIVVDASFSAESPMSGGELRELAGVLPPPTGNAGKLPPVLSFMPPRGYISNTQKLAVGPASFSALAAPISADLVNFSADPDVTMGRYTTPSGDAALMLIYYPNSQLAAEQFRRIDGNHPADNSKGISEIDNTGQFLVKRTGPILAIASGEASANDMKSLLGQVNYEANVTWSQRTFLDKNNDVGGLLVNIILLCFILGAMAIVAGVAFGGFRILMKRWFPDRLFDRPEQMEIIALHLTETAPRGPSRIGTEEPPTPRGKA